MAVRVQGVTGTRVAMGFWWQDENRQLQGCNGLFQGHGAGLALPCVLALRLAVWLGFCQEHS